MKFFSFWRSLASFRVRIALNLKGIQPQVIDINLIKGDQRNAEFRKINPQMLLPAIVDGDQPVLFQSLAILEYLDETYPEPPLLPKEPRARARVRALANIVACDAHPLIVPRVRNFLEQEFKLDEKQRMVWVRHWIVEALEALETHLGRDRETGRYCHDNQVTIADLCLVSHVVGAKLFDVDVKPYPIVMRIFEICMAVDAFARAHPLRQPGAPSSPTH